MDCVDGVLRKSNFCPLDGYAIYNPLSRTPSERKTSLKLSPCFSSGCARQPENDFKDLFVPGVALWVRNPKTAPSHGSLNLEVLAGSSETLNIPQKVITNQFLGSCVTTTDGPTKQGKDVLQRKQSLVCPESSSVSQLNKSAARLNSCSSKKTSAARTSASSNVFFPVSKMREQPQPNLFVGQSRAEPENPATVFIHPRRSRLQN